MELKEFIKISVNEITDAVRELKKEQNNPNIPNNGFEQNPISPNYSNLNNKQTNRSIDFDIAVISSENKTDTKEGRVGIKVVGGEIYNTSATTQENSSRIKFSIPFYPEYIK